MTEQSPAEVIFFAALEKGTPEERAAYLDEACGNDSDLRGRVERLLAAHPQVGSFLEQPVQAEAGLHEAATNPPIEKGQAATGLPETTAYHDPSEGAGSIIAARYKLLEQIGEGGMGAVWVAEQTQPVRRKVALKLIKAGMDSKTVLARFEAERQALALMDHPNIAKVLDGGTTEGGRPFFVMEYVKGVPLTGYCDDASLSVAERLTLFMPVCQAVQHAHQKGIIHRDLKPSNILICLYDGKPVPKVIDFGLAKAMHQPLTEHTLHTAHGVMMGTPLYMSPEQAEFNNLDVDTRTDIYALGVVLYELLTGTTPLEKQRFKEAAWYEMLRVIKEEEPQRPSARLSGSASLPSLAAQRQLEPAKLARLMRGELDWIVMKCLEKDRSRRYDTANGLARDLERYLHDEVVEARPPTAGYRLRKFASKHRVGIATVSAFAVVLLVAAGVSAFLAIKARRAEDVAEIKRIEAEWNAKLAEHNLELYSASLDENLNAYEEANVRATGLQIDLDLQEIHTNPPVGLLRLARTVKMIPKDALLTIPGVRDESKFDPLIELMKKASEATGKKYRVTMPGASRASSGNPKMVPLREFGTMAVLATGQTFAPLLPPITHDGERILTSPHNSKGDRLLTSGADKTARFWDPFTGRQIAILRRADEKLICAGFSPDGASAFTHSLDGVVRLWDTKEGTFRAETESRKERVKFVGFHPFTPFENPDHAPGAAAAQRFTQLSNDRVLTSSEVWEAVPTHNLETGSVDYSAHVIKSRGPAELWDAKTGRFIARLEQSEVGNRTWTFFGNGRWIAAQEGFTIGVLSAENGRPIAKLNHPGKKYLSIQPTPIVSPSGRVAATVASLGRLDFDVYCWDTTSWQLSSITGPVEISSPSEIMFVADEFLAGSTMPDGQFRGLIYRTGSATPVIQLPSLPSLIQGERVFCSAGQLFDTRTWRRLQPPKGRKYHPEIARLAPDGRFFPLWNPAYDPCAFIDTATEKTFQLLEDQHYFYQPKVGWVTATNSPSQIELTRLPPLEHLEIPPDLLELWAQVAFRGQLDDEGAFAKWDEATWEKKRQELAAKPAPYADFPFPGHVATDRLHWLRQEYLQAREADRPGLAKKLLDRAEAAGDRAEAIRWRAIVTPKSPPKKPASKPNEP